MTLATRGDCECGGEGSAGGRVWGGDGGYGGGDGGADGVGEGRRFRAIKGVSDGYDFELSALAKFEGERGSFRTGAFAVYTAVRPWTWGKAIELGRGSAKALAGLEAALRGVLAGLGEEFG